MTRNEALKKAEENLLAAEIGVINLGAADRVELRIRLARGWVELARELDKRA